MRQGLWAELEVEDGLTDEVFSLGEWASAQWVGSDLGGH